MTFVRLLAPILSFTCEEVWRYLPALDGRPESVHLDRFLSPQEICEGEEQEGNHASDWVGLRPVRDQVLKALEEARKQKLIGGSLEAQIKLTASDPLFPILERRLDQLRYLFIVSAVTIDRSASGNGTSGLEVEVLRAAGEKCERCWNYSTRVGEDRLYPTVCERCAQVLNGRRAAGS